MRNRLTGHDLKRIIASYGCDMINPTNASDNGAVIYPGWSGWHIPVSILIPSPYAAERARLGTRVSRKKQWATIVLGLEH
jgi:hypothetical protein